MSDSSKAEKDPQVINQTSKEGDTKCNSSKDNKSKMDNKAGSAGGARKKENKKLGEMGKLMYGCQSFGN